MTRCLLTCVAACLTTAVVTAADPKPRLDADGFPLPAEAVRRFGSTKFCTDPPRSVTFSPDGKTAYLGRTSGGVRFVQGHKFAAASAWDVATGRLKWEFVSDELTGQQIAADPDGKTIWVVGYTGHGDLAKCPFVRVKLAADSGKELERKQLHSGWSEAFDLRPDGALAWARDDRPQNDLSLPITRPDGTELTRWEPDNQYIRLVKYAPDGQAVFVGGPTFNHKGYKLTAADPATGKSRWSIGCPSCDFLVVSPDSKVIAAVMKGSPIRDDPRWARAGVHTARVVGWNAETGAELGSCDVGGTRHNEYEADRNRPFVFTPDGAAILIPDSDRRTVRIDLKTWTAGEPQPNPSARGWLVPGNKQYIAHTGHNLTLFDATTHKPLLGSPPPLDHQPNFDTTGLRFSPDGERLIRGRAYRERVTWDVSSGRESAREPWAEVARNGVAEQFRFWSDTPHPMIAPNGKVMACPKPDAAGVLEIVSTGDRKPVAELTGVPSRAVLAGLAFSPDSRHLVAGTSHEGIWVWELNRGGKPDRVNAERLPGESGGSLDPIRFHPAGGRVALIETFNSMGVQEGWRIATFDLAPAKRLQAWSGNGKVWWFDYTRQGRIVGVLRENKRGGREDSSLFEINPESGRLRVHPLDAPVYYGAVSPDGRTLAVGTKDDIHLYELVTGKRRHTFVGLTRPAEVLAFSPDGRFLATESADGPVLLWDVRGDLTKPAKPDAAGWDKTWAALGGEDATAAFQTVRLFALYPEDGVPELRKRFAGLKPPSDEAIAALVAKLGDADFQTREQAEKELKGVGSAAFPALKQSLDGGSEEVRARANRLLAVAVPPDQLRAGRAMEALTLAGTAEAKKLLAEWAKATGQ